MSISAAVVGVVPGLKVCKAVHVGAMDCDRAGVASERIALVAEPLLAVRPIVADGLAVVARISPELMACNTPAVVISTPTAVPPAVIRIGLAAEPDAVLTLKM